MIGGLVGALVVLCVAGTITGLYQRYTPTNTTAIHYLHKVANLILFHYNL